MNKKGASELALTLIPIIALILVVFALYSFFDSSDGFGDLSKETSEMMWEAEIAENYIRTTAEIIFDEAINCENCQSADLKGKVQEIALLHDFNYGGQGNFFGKIRNGEFEIVEDGGKYKLVVKDVFVKVTRGMNEVERKFDVDAKYKGPCRVHFSGVFVSDHSNMDKVITYNSHGFTKIWKSDLTSDIVKPGYYPKSSEVLIKSSYKDEFVDHTFDSLAISSGVRLIIYNDENFKGNIIFDKTGPLIVYNSLLGSKFLFYNFEQVKEEFSRDWKEPYQTEFPQSVRIWSDSNMHNWADGSMKIICLN